MIAPLELAKLCQSIYQTDQGWDHYWAYDKVVVALKRSEQGDIIVLRGSQALIDWGRDLAAIPEHHGALGLVHAGFIAGMDDVFAEVQAAITGRPIITGHSLGAARAMLLAGLFVAAGKPPQQIAAFGCPRPGGKQLRDMICGSGTLIMSQRNEADPVTYVPFLPNIFYHVIEPFEVHGGAVPGDASIFREHSISQYIIANSGA